MSSSIYLVLNYLYPVNMYTMYYFINIGKLCDLCDLCDSRSFLLYGFAGNNSHYD